MIVLGVEVVNYTEIVLSLEDTLGVYAVAKMHERIRSFIDEGLEKLGFTREESVKLTTGDGAILVFDNADTAHDFAHSVHRKTQECNRGVRTGQMKFCFRMGAASGDLSSRREAIAGGVIIDAVRFEALANPGELLIDPETKKGLSPKRQRQYQPREEVTVKGEVFHVYRSIMVPETQESATTGVSKQVVYKKLHLHIDQWLMLALLRNEPKGPKAIRRHLSEAYSDLTRPKETWNQLDELVSCGLVKKLKSGKYQLTKKGLEEEAQNHGPLTLPSTVMGGLIGSVAGCVLWSLTSPADPGTIDPLESDDAPDAGTQEVGDESLDGETKDDVSLLQAYETFRDELSELLRTHAGHWVAYRGREQVGIAGTGTELYRECSRRGWTLDEYLVACIEPQLDEDEIGVDENVA